MLYGQASMNLIPILKNHFITFSETLTRAAVLNFENAYITMKAPMKCKFFNDFYNLYISL